MPEPDGSDIPILNASESVAVEGDHRRPLGGLRAEHVTPAAHPEFVGRGGVVLPETTVGKGEEIRLESVAEHGAYYTSQRGAGAVRRSVNRLKLSTVTPIALFPAPRTLVR